MCNQPVSGYGQQVLYLSPQMVHVIALQMLCRTFAAVATVEHWLPGR
jgi:hypothetical protein